MKNYTSAVIVAAGNSTRMGLGFSKQLIPICSKPAIYHTVKAFQDCPLIDEVVVVARSVDIEEIGKAVFCFPKVSSVLKGGTERIESVLQGVRGISPNADFIAVHDGARVLITPEDIENVVKTAFVTGAAALATPVTDTVKVAGEDRVVISTPDRSTLFAVQTPQVFGRSLYERAVKNALEKGLKVTDDCSMVEALSEPVTLVSGSYSNIKLTTQVDIIIAETILSKRK